MPCDILNLEWSSSGRDIDIIEPVLLYLERKYSLNIIRDSMADYAYKVIKYKPKMVLISNGIGAVRNKNLMRLSSKLGIKVVTLIAEGDVPDTNLVEAFFWGNNAEKFFYQDLHLEWSKRNVENIKKLIPAACNYNIKVSGATGFDRYRFAQFMSKSEFVNLCAKGEYEKVIGIAAWGFDLVLGKYSDQLPDMYKGRMDQETLNIHRKNKDLLQHIYRTLIEQNKDILFVLKYHPGMLQEELTELHGLEEYQNVVSLRGSEINIGDVINACDLWIAYESTTCLEAWLLGKKTMLIAPLNFQTGRSEIAQGSPIKTTYKDVQIGIDHFYQSNQLIGFDELEDKRKALVSDIIQWDDGKNHIRAGEYIYEEMTREKKSGSFADAWIIKELAKGLIVRCLIKTNLIHIALIQHVLPTDFSIIQQYNPQERLAISDIYKKQLKNFYLNHAIKCER